MTSISLNLLKHPSIDDVPSKFCENKQLYLAQKAAKEIFSNFTFLKKEETVKNAFLNKVYTVIKFFNLLINKIYSLFRAIVVFGVFNALLITDYLLGWLLRPIINFVFPINPINGNRFFCFFPKVIEKLIGEFIYRFCSEYDTSEFLIGSKVAMSDKIEQIFNQILKANSNLLNPSDESVKFNYQIRTIPSKDANAYAYPAGGVTVLSSLVKEINEALCNKTIRYTDVHFPSGGKIRVNLSDVKLEDVMAALLGHEMTHVASRHYNHSIIVILITRIIAYIFNIEEELAELIELFNSRQNEYEADITGIYLANKAHYNPLGALFLHEFLRNYSIGFMHKKFEFLYTHPYSENRKLAAFAAINEINQKNLQKHIIK